MIDDIPAPMNRRTLFAHIGRVAGGAAMYEAMTSLAHAAESTFKAPISLSGAPGGASVLVLGSGLAGMVAAYELRKAGYKVQILEYQGRPGGRSWSLHGGDSYTELGGFTQHIGFDKGQYFNPGPWRIPHHHQALLHYCKLLGVKLEPFNQVNYNAYVHSTKAFGGKPQRYRTVQADFHGSVAELLGKSVQQGKLDDPVTKEDQEILLQALRDWGALDSNYRYSRNLTSANRRGYDQPPGGGLNGTPVPSDPIALGDLLKSGLWRSIGQGQAWPEQTTMFQPVGGMGMIGRAFGKLTAGVTRFNAKVTRIQQDENGVTASYVDSIRGGPVQTVKADWCVCTIPASILSQIPMDIGPAMQSAIYALPYAPSAKVGVQMKRRFWEEDEQIYGGITYTDLPNAIISYPSTDYLSPGKGVLLAGYTFGAAALEYTSMLPPERIAKTLEYCASIHPQFRTEYENGVSVAWHRVPWLLGCFGQWSEAMRAAHYDNICAIDGRIVLAGEHVSKIPAWQEGAILSSLDAIGRLHQHVMQR